MSLVYSSYKISQESVLLIVSGDEYENDDQDNDTEKDRRR